MISYIDNPFRAGTLLIVPRFDEIPNVVTQLHRTNDPLSVASIGLEVYEIDHISHNQVDISALFDSDIKDHLFNLGYSPDKDGIIHYEVVFFTNEMISSLNGLKALLSIGKATIIHEN